VRLQTESSQIDKDLVFGRNVIPPIDGVVLLIVSSKFLFLRYIKILIL